MTFHLEGPWLNKSGKTKVKKKFKSSAEKQAHLKLEQEWQEIQNKWKKESKVKIGSSVQKTNLSPTIPEGRNTTKDIKSLNTIGGVGSVKETQQYTGEKLIGISQMAKSNAVPVFNQDHIIEIARMRR